MKLMFCDNCQDVFKLATEELRRCKCGRVEGRYLVDGRGAISNGKGFCLAIGNGSIMQGIAEMEMLRKDTHDKASRQDYIKHGAVLAWIRPHEGPGNPHMTIVEDL
jgi:hypothetical protein